MAHHQLQQQCLEDVDEEAKCSALSMASSPLSMASTASTASSAASSTGTATKTNATSISAYRSRTASLGRDIINFLTFRREVSAESGDASAATKRQKHRSWSVAMHRNRASSDPAKAKTQASSDEIKTQASAVREDSLRSAAAARFAVGDLLNDDLVAKALTSYCEAHLCGENLRCLRAVEQLESKMDHTEDWHVSACAINTRYVKSDAPDWVCLCPSLANNLQRALEAHDKAQVASVLSAAKVEACRTLDTDTVPRFVNAVLTDSDAELQDRMLDIHAKLTADQAETSQ